MDLTDYRLPALMHPVEIWSGLINNRKIAVTSGKIMMWYILLLLLE